MFRNGAGTKVPPQRRLQSPRSHGEDVQKRQEDLS
jgi:hypothetical protein